jgi:nitrogen regulatory protein PII
MNKQEEKSKQYKAPIQTFNHTSGSGKNFGLIHQTTSNEIQVKEEEEISLAISETKREMVEKLIELKEKSHEVDGEAFGYELLEAKDRCCSGDDATAVYEITIDKIIKLLSKEYEKENNKIA